LIERGFQVRALVRNPDKAQQLTAQGVSLIEGDLHNSSALEQLVADSAIVIHGAGAVRGRSQEAFDQVNVAGTAALLRALSSRPTPPRLLLISSLAAREPELSWYAHSKRDGEKLLQREPGLDWIIVRPPAVYGPGDKEMLPVFQLMARGIAVVPGSARARISLIHVCDLVAAIIACLESPATRNQPLTPCYGKPGGYNWRELADIAAATWGRRVRIWRVPAWLLDTVARLNITLAAITGGAPMLTPAKLCELRHPDWVVNNETITATTGWTPDISLRKGLEEIRNSAL
jgi:nucleoside-diphosphate-sugar epimerase